MYTYVYIYTYVYRHLIESGHRYTYIMITIDTHAIGHILYIVRGGHRQPYHIALNVLKRRPLNIAYCHIERAITAIVWRILRVVYMFAYMRNSGFTTVSRSLKKRDAQQR